MQLLGMLDSPFVRRVAISFQLLGVTFEHRSLSVFSTYDQFRLTNPVVKAPTLICDDGSILMDSTLIIEYGEGIASKRSLMPATISERLSTLRIIGLALAACEKSVQIVYERNLRPSDKQYQPWISRVTDQLLAAYILLESEVQHMARAPESQTIDQGSITAAIAWHFTQMMIPETVPKSRFPALEEFSINAERLLEFVAAPHGAGTYHPGG